MGMNSTEWQPAPTADRQQIDIFSSLKAGLGAALVRATDALLDRIERRRELAQLAQMDARALKDIGLVPGDLGLLDRAERSAEGGAWR